MTPAADASLDISRDLTDAVAEIRGSLIQMLASVEADVASPRAMARQLDVDKNLSWKISRVIHAEEASDAIRHLPGRSGIDKFLQATIRAGASVADVDRAGDAIARFERVVEIHVDDRATLDVVLSSMSGTSNPEPLAAARKQAYLGCSAIWGVQARLRFSVFILAPSACGGGILDIMTIGGVADLRRFRANINWPVQSNLGYNDDGSPRSIESEPIDADLPPGAPPLMAEFCSRPLPEIRSVSRPTGFRYDLAPGPIGNRGAVTAVFGHISRAFASVYRDAVNTRAELPTQSFTPAKHLMSVVLIHRDLPFPGTPEVTVDSLLTAGAPEMRVAGEVDRLPCSEQVQTLAGTPPLVATPLLPDLPAIVSAGHKRLGTDPADFRGYRLMMKYPPLPTSIILHMPLADPP